MKLLYLFALALSLDGASLYVSSTGNDSTGNGTSGNPWLTLSKALSSMACGDTINIVANGVAVGGDANLPSLPGCTLTNTIQSSAIAQFAPAGYRTNPANDNAIYGKLKFTSQGISAAAEVHGNNIPTYNCTYMSDPGVVGTANTSGTAVTWVSGNQFRSTWAGQAETISFYDSGGNLLSTNNISTVTDATHLTLTATAGTHTGATFVVSSLIVTVANPGVFTVGCAAGMLGGLANGDQVEFEALTVNPFPSFTLPSPLVLGQHYYVVNQSGGGAYGATFEVAATSGGTPINITACDANCQGRTIMAKPVAVNTSTDTLTIPSALVNIANDTPVVVAAAGSQSYGTLPTSTPQIALDTIYYVVNKTDSTHIQLSTQKGGSPIDFTADGTGMFSIANADVPKGWAFRGLELAPNGGALLGYLLQIGGATELSPVGMPTDFEVDRVYCHGNDTVALGQFQALGRCLNENGIRVHVHDSYFSGATYSEAQAVLSTQSQGADYINNFLEGATENVMCGGQAPSGGLPCGHHLFQGNYFYHPPTWKYTIGTALPSGSCLYDTYDSLRSGGEWYQRTSPSQLYQCGADFAWHTSAGTPQSTNISFKDCSEHKNGTDISYIGNIYNNCFTGGQDEVFNNSTETNDSGPGALNNNILIQNNAIYNSWIFSTRSARCGADAYMTCLKSPGNHTTVNNLFVMNQLACGVGFDSFGCAYLPNQDTWGSYVAGGTLQGDVKSHNTFWSPDSCCLVGGSTRFPSFFYGNQTTGGTYFAQINLAFYSNNVGVGDFNGDAAGGGTTLADYFTNGTWTHNAWRGATGSYSSVGATNTWNTSLNPLPANLAAVKFVNGTGTMAGDYHLDPTSNYSAANGSATLLSTDGTDLGADIDLINMATSGVLSGTPPWDKSLVINPGSTKVVFRYEAQTTAACTATIYSAPARISGNQVASVADSAASSISDVLTRQLYISGLTASTHYWHKLDCGGGVIMVGDFFTRAAGSGTYTFGFDWSAATAMRYSSSATMSSPTNLGAATHQDVPVSANSVIYAQVGTTGPIAVLVAP